MKKFNFPKLYSWLLILFFSVTSYSGFAQGFNTTNWKFSNPKQFGFTVLDVDYFDNNSVIAVGSDGGIAKSTDGGTNWTYGVFTFLGTNGFVQKPSFSDVHYATATVAYAVGTPGCMAKTTDGGLTWNFVTTPLYAGAKNIDAVWFLNKDTGYIGGQWNTPDSLPKLYITKNGGTTWDSIAAPPANGKSRVGYVNNVNIPSAVVDFDAKAKEIYTIQFLNDSVGYVCGSGSSLFPAVPGGSANGTTCLPNGGTLTGSASNAALLWKINKGVPTDYSISKERIGFSGVVTNTVTCTTSYNAAQITPVPQTYRAMNIINDSTVVLMSFNNNIVLKVNTGKNDSTLNRNVAGLYEKGKYQVLNFPSLPAGPDNGPSIPAVQVLTASNPYHMLRSTAGTLVVGTYSTNFGPGFLYTSVDTGRNWIRRSVYPQNQNWSQAVGAPAIDFAPNGKLLALGNNGVVGDSTSGGTWKSNYISVPLSASYTDIEFADCNNGIAAGGSGVTVTTDGGQTWVDKANSGLAGLNANITSVTYPQVNKVYFTTNIGTIYRSVNQGTNLTPVFIDNYGGTSGINDLAVQGTDSIWACGVQQTSPAAINRFGLVYRSFNNGATWDTVKVGPIGNVGTQAQQFVTFKGIEFPSKNIGYICGNRGAVYKTTDAGATWTNISPFPAINIGPTGFTSSAVSYTDIIALDNNTVFVVGNMFTSVNNRRIYKTTDGGATWVDIASNIDLLSGGNLNGILMHDANNGYVSVPGGVLYVTNNGGASWTMDLGPTSTLTTALAFAPKTVPSSISMANRKMFVTGANISGAPLMEYGNPANTYVNATTTITGTSCTNLTSGAITVNTTGGITPYKYSLNGGAFQTSNVFSGLKAGKDTITITDAYCGTFTTIVTVPFTDNLTLTTSNDTAVCAGAPVQLIATSAANTYAWTPTTGLSNAAINNPIASIANTTAYTVTASLNGCVRTKTVNVTFKASPAISAGPDYTIVFGDAVTLQGSGSSVYQSLLWTPASSVTNYANSYLPVVKPTTTTTYTLTVKDNNNCTSTDDAIVTVIPYCINIMNAFTPNGDGINDKWLVTSGGACTKQISVAVYNRYGGLVYKNEAYQNNWDGTYSGKPVPDGTYYYAITYQLINGNVVTLKGDVTILR